MQAWIRLWRNAQRALFRRAQDDRDLDEELRFHVEQETALRAERGEPAAEAERRARIALGSMNLVKERTRAVWVSAAFEQCVQDLRLGCRIVVRSPGLTATVILMVAVVVGANTTVFSMVNGLLTKPAAGVRPTGLITVHWIESGGFVEPATSYANYLDLTTESSATSLAAFAHERFALSTSATAQVVWGELVSANFFQTLGLSLVTGRMFTEDEATGRSGLVAIVSDRAWREHFSGASQLSMPEVLLNGHPATIIGVAAPPFRGVSHGAPPVDVWVPVTSYRQIRNEADFLADRTRPTVGIVGRLRPGFGLERARAEIEGRWERLKIEYPEIARELRVAVIPYSANAGGNSLAVSRAGTFLGLFSIVTVLTVFVVCANVGNLLLGRALAREREITLRQVLGASRWRLTRMLLAESAALAVLGWMAACAVAWWTSRAVSGWVAPATGRSLDFTPDWSVVTYAFALAALAMVGFMMAPVLWTRRLELLRVVRSGEHGVVAGHSRLTRSLAIVQLAGSVVLLTHAALAYRSLAKVEHIDLGYDTGRLLLVRVNTASAATTPASHATMLEEIRQALMRVSGIEAVSYAVRAAGERWESRRVRADSSDPGMTVGLNQVGPGFFRLHGLSPIAGREFGSEDAAQATHEVVVTKALAEALWPGGSALGRTLLLGAQPTATAQVIGVVPDARFSGFTRDARPRFVFVASQRSAMPPGEATFYVRRRTTPDTGTGLRDTIRGLDTRLAVAGIVPMDDQLSNVTWPARALVILLLCFAAGAVLIAIVGQYAVVMFGMRRRIREFGLRLALGASPSHLVSTVVWQGLRLTLWGVSAGFALSALTGMALAGLFYGVTPMDPLSHAAVVGILIPVSLAACYLPAHHASRINPVEMLRHE